MSFAHIDRPVSETLTSTGTVVATAQGRVLAIHLSGGSSDGTVVLKDGGASGTQITSVAANTNEDSTIEVPGAGLPFGTDLHATITNVASVTVFYVLDTPMSLG